MKFLFSSSSSASSTASTFDIYLCNPKNATSGCLAGMLRRLLRLNTLPTHPFDHSKGGGNESKQFGEIDCTKNEGARFGAPGNPGIVAKLMGLDSMPEIELGCGKANLNSITRSRSMNYVDSRREGTMQGKHRRNKSTFSFREAPPFVELETEDFFILSFEGGGKDKELVLKPRRSDSSFGELKQMRVGKCKNKNTRRESGYGRNKENEVPNVVSSDGNEGDVEDSCKILRQNTNLNHNSHAVEEVAKQSKPIRRKQTGERRRSRRKKKESCSPVEKVEILDDSENSSPVSVLDFGELPLEPKVSNPGEDSRLRNSNSRRKLSGELERYKHFCPCSTDDSNINDIDGKADNSEAKHFESWKIDRKFQNYAEMWEDVSKLAETEIMKSNNIQRETNKVEEYEEIGTAFGQEILDHLISEFLELLTSKREILAL